MLIRDAARLESFTALDGCSIREIINPDRDQTDPGLSLALAEVAPGRATRPHRLSFLEVYYILEGQGLMHVDEEASPVGPGQAVYIPAGQSQWIENTGGLPLKFLCICHPGYKPEGDEAEA